MKRFEEIWREQCGAARRIMAKHGLVPAVDYLVGEKLDQFAQTAASRPEFARELPSFVSEIRRVFSRQDIADYFASLEDDARRSNIGPIAADLEEAGLVMTPQEKRARVKRLDGLKKLLLAEQLGTA